MARLVGRGATGYETTINREDRTMDEMDKEHDATSASPSHDMGTGKGEEKSSTEGKEAGRHDHADTHADRPAGGSTARDATSINPDNEDSIDPNSPSFPPA
jgi:hypothetical protein